MRKLISVGELREMAGDSKQVNIPSECVLTPSALDMAREQGITLVWGGQKTEDKSSCCAAVGKEKEPVVVPAGNSGITEDSIRAIVTSVVGKVLKPACENPQVTLVEGKSVVPVPFTEGPPGSKIHITDVVTKREGNLCCGIMTFDHSSLPWHLTYDESDYIIEGTLTLQANGKTYTANAGDMMYIPKNTSVVFGTPNFVKIFYSTYPANWFEIKE